MAAATTAPSPAPVLPGRPEGEKVPVVSSSPPSTIPTNGLSSISNNSTATDGSTGASGATSELASTQFHTAAVDMLQTDSGRPSTENTVVVVPTPTSSSATPSSSSSAVSSSPSPSAAAPAAQTLGVKKHHRTSSSSSRADRPRNREASDATVHAFPSYSSPSSHSRAEENQVGDEQRSSSIAVPPLAAPAPLAAAAGTAGGAISSLIGGIARRASVRLSAAASCAPAAAPSPLAPSPSPSQVEKEKSDTAAGTEGGRNADTTTSNQEEEQDKMMLMETVYENRGPAAVAPHHYVHLPLYQHHHQQQQQEVHSQSLPQQQQQQQQQQQAEQQQGEKEAPQEGGQSTASWLLAPIANVLCPGYAPQEQQAEAAGPSSLSSQQQQQQQQDTGTPVQTQQQRSSSRNRGSMNMSDGHLLQQQQSMQQGGGGGATGTGTGMGLQHSTTLSTQQGTGRRSSLRASTSSSAAAAAAAKKKAVAPPELLVIVRPPSKQVHPLNLQVQLIIPPAQQQPQGSVAATATKNGSTPSLPASASSTSALTSQATPSAAQGQTGATPFLPASSVVASAKRSSLDPVCRRSIEAAAAQGQLIPPKYHGQIVLPDDPQPVVAQESAGGEGVTTKANKRLSVGSVVDVPQASPQPNRRHSISSTRSDHSATSAAGAASGITNLGAGAPSLTSISSLATRSKVTPLYNLTFHSLLPTVITDAAAEQRVAKVNSKKGYIDIEGFGQIVPKQLVVGVNDLATLQRQEQMQSQQQQRFAATSPVSEVTASTVNAKPAPPATVAKPEKFAPPTRADTMETNVSYETGTSEDAPSSLAGAAALLSARGTANAREAAARATALLPPPAPQPTSSSSPGGAGLTVRGTLLASGLGLGGGAAEQAQHPPTSFQAMTPSAKADDEHMLQRSSTTSGKPKSVGGKLLRGIKRLSLSGSPASSKGSSSAAPADNVAAKVFRRASLDPSTASAPLPKDISSTAATSEAAALAEAYVPMVPIERRAGKHEKRAEGYVWTVRKWSRKVQLDEAAENDTASVSSSASNPSSYAATSRKAAPTAAAVAEQRDGYGPGQNEILSRVWKKFNMVNRLRMHPDDHYEIHPDVRSIPVRFEWTRDTPRVQRRRAIEEARAAAAAGLVPSASKTSKSPRMPSRSPSRRGSLPGPGSPSGGASIDLAASGSASGASNHGEEETSSSKADTDHSSGEEDNETPWNCHLVLGPQTKIPIATLVPSPHHQRVFGQLAIPFPLPDLSTSGLGADGAGLTREELKDIISVTALHLVVRENFGNIANRKK